MVRDASMLLFLCTCGTEAGTDGTPMLVNKRVHTFTNGTTFVAARGHGRVGGTGSSTGGASLRRTLEGSG